MRKFKETIFFGNEFCSEKCYHLHKRLEVPSSIPKEFIRDFIRGVFDADGNCCVANDNQISFSLVSSVKSFLEEIQNILIINCFLNKTKISSNHNESCYDLRYMGNKQCLRIFDYLYKNCNLKLQRKYDTIINHFKFGEIK